MRRSRIRDRRRARAEARTSTAEPANPLMATPVVPSLARSRARVSKPGKAGAERAIPRSAERHPRKYLVTPPCSRDRIRAFSAAFPWIHRYMHVSPATSLFDCIERKPHALLQLGGRAERESMI